MSRAAPVIVAGVVLGALLGQDGLRSAASRFALAALLAGIPIITSLRRPRIAVLICLLSLPALALLRRLLIPISGWDSYDPLLLVAPAVCLFLLVRLFLIERRSLTQGGLSK